MPTKILITGGSGFLGQNIIQKIKQRYKNWEIYNLSKTAINDKRIKNIKINAEKDKFPNINIEFDYIINTLALSNVKYCNDLKKAEKVNIEFTKNLLFFAKKQKNLKKFIHISSIIIYDNLNTPPVKEDAKLYFNYSNYSFTKGMAENYVNYYSQKLNLSFIIFRLANIYGPYQQYINSPFLIPSKIVQGLTDGKIEVLNLSPKRDWIYSEDAADAIIKALKTTYKGILNLGSGKGESVKKIVTEISKNLKVKIVSLNKETSGPLNFYCDIKKTKNILNWKPKTNIKNGIKKTINYIKNYENSNSGLRS